MQMSKSLTLSAADQARVRELLDSHPDETAALQCAVRGLLVQALTPFEGRIWTEREVADLLSGLIEPIVSTVADAGESWQQDVASLLTRHALVQAQTEIVHWLLWAKRN